MLNKIIILLLVIFVIATLPSCSPSLPTDGPNLGIDVDISQLNAEIKVTVPKSINSYQLGKPVELEIENLSNEVWEFGVSDIQIFHNVNNLWQKVSYETKTIIVDDLVLEPGEDNSKNKMILEPNGFKRYIDVSPNIKSDKSILLRIYVFAYSPEIKNESSNVVGAFVDVTLFP